MLVQTKTDGSQSGPIQQDRSASPEQPEVSVVLPCLNEAGSVAKCVCEAIDTMADAGISGEIVVVDNGSTDGSRELAEAAGARVITESRPGYGRAVRTGIEASRGPIVVMGDADWSYDFTKLPLLVRPVQEGQADLVMGSRLNNATRRSMPVLHRYIGTPVLSFLIRRATGGLAVADSQTGYRAFRKETA